MYLLAGVHIRIVYWCTQRGGWGRLQAEGRKTDCNSKSNLTQRSHTQRKKKQPVIQMEQPDRTPREENFDNRAEENAKTPPCVSLAHLWSFQFIFKSATTSSSTSVLMQQCGVGRVHTQVLRSALKHSGNEAAGKKRPLGSQEFISTWIRISRSLTSMRCYFGEISQAHGAMTCWLFPCNSITKSG